MEETWPCFVAYLAIYLVAWGLGWPLGSVVAIFDGLHIVFGLGLLIFWARRFRREDAFLYAFWIGLFLLLLVPGAYLEYPSDPWEHFRRIFSWQTCSTIGECQERARFSYFWNFTAVNWAGFTVRRQALGVVSAFWQLAIFQQWYLLCRKLGQSRALAMVQVVAFFALFGNSVFGLRYYALAPMPMAYVGYLAALRTVLQFLDERKLRPFSLFFQLALILSNHVQEMVFFALATSVWVALHLLHAKTKHWERQRVAKVLLTLVVFGIVFGILHRHFRPQFYARLGENNFMPFGGVKLWSLLRLVNAWGFSGLLALIFAMLYLRRYVREAVLTLALSLGLLYPPWAWIVGRKLELLSDSYRLIYAFPTSMMLVLGLSTLFRRRLGEHATAGAVLVCVIILGIPARFPFRGRLFFQFHQPSAERTLLAQEMTLIWLRANRNYPSDCWILSDDATYFFLNASLGRRVKGDFGQANVRLQPNRFAQRLTSLNAFRELHRKRDVCGIFVPNYKKLPATPASPVARLSGHWPEALGDLRSLASAEFTNAARGLELVGWTRVEVPPYYDLYEPARDGRWHLW